ncbi:MAG: ArsR/SmtB family transcription factor, partial [Geminicoccaceae bacterium]
MISGNALAATGALFGDPARANILLALMDGRALTAGELAWHAGVSAQTTSAHLARLVDARLVSVVQQGRHRYHRLTSREVAGAIEAVATLAVIGPQRHRPTGPRDEALRAARTCYNHLAGRLAVAIADGLAARGYLDLHEADSVGGQSESGVGFLRDTL